MFQKQRKVCIAMQTFLIGFNIQSLNLKPEAREIIFASSLHAILKKTTFSSIPINGNSTGKKTCNSDSLTRINDVTSRTM